MSGLRYFIIVSLLCACVIIACPVYAQYDRPGSSGAQFLKIGISPRGAAMGGAYIAATEGAEGAYYNAASLAWINGNDVVFNHTVWFADIKHEFGAVAHTFGDIGTFAISVTALYTDLMPVRTPLQPDGTGETFSAGSYRGGISYARFLTDRVTIGATVNVIYEKLYSTFTASAVSGDIAAMYMSDWRAFRFGMQISHFGSDMKFVNESYPLPTNITFGLAMNAVDGDEHKVLFSISGTKPNDGKPLAAVGGEWNVMGIVFLRGGYQLNHDVATYSLGSGVRADVLGYHARFDYSYSKYSLLGGAHRFGLGVGF